MENSSVDILSLANAVVFDPEGRQLKLGQVWNSAPAILIFLRHFACISCRAHAVQVWSERQKYEKNGARIVFIGNGQPQFIQTFKEDLGLQEALILTDPSLMSFQAAGLRNGYLAVIQLNSVIDAIKLAVDGHTQSAYSKEAGTHWQLGGIVAIGQDGKVLYRYASQSLGDFPDSDIDVIVQAERSVVQKKSLQ
jgi:peroxiredoxin